MTPAMYIFVNKGLGMSLGKAMAQAGHAAVEGYRISMTGHPERREPVSPHMNQAALYETNVVRRWYRGGHYMKLVMEARDSEHLRDIERYLNNRGFKTALILDEGHTEVDAIVPTALGVEILDKDDPHVQSTFSSFDLYRDGPPTIEGVAVEERPQRAPRREVYRAPVPYRRMFGLDSLGGLRR